jgi:hypothetical protein
MRHTLAWKYKYVDYLKLIMATITLQYIVECGAIYAIGIEEKQNRARICKR